VAMRQCARRSGTDVELYPVSKQMSKVSALFPCGKPTRWNDVRRDRTGTEGATSHENHLYIGEVLSSPSQTQLHAPMCSRCHDIPILNSCVPPYLTTQIGYNGADCATPIKLVSQQQKSVAAFFKPRVSSAIGNDSTRVAACTKEQSGQQNSPGARVDDEEPKLLRAEDEERSADGVKRVRLS